MINFLKNWVQQIVVAAIIVSVFELILPEGKMKKYIKVILGVYVVFCLISPFVDNNALYKLQNIDLEESLQNLSETQETTASADSVDLRLQQLYIQELEKDIKQRIKENGYETYKCSIDADLKSSSSNPGIHKINLVIYKQTGNIEKVDINLKEENMQETELVQ